MKKIVIIFSLLILLLTGCTADYEVTINEDLSVKEELKVYEDKTYFQNKSSSVSEIVDEFANSFSNILVGSEVIDYRKGENAGKYIKTEYQDVCDSFKIIDATNIFSETSCNYDGEIITLKFSDLNDLQGESDSIADAADINNITYNIPFKVVETKNFECNVNDGKTLCVAKITREDKKGKDYKIKFSRLSLPVNEEIKDKKNNESNENKSGLIILLIIIGIVIIGVGIFIYKKYRQNKLDY